MNEEKLIISAQELKQPSEEATRIYYDKIDTIAEELNRIMLGRPDVDRLIGMNNMEMMENNSRNYLRFMGAIFHSSVSNNRKNQTKLMTAGSNIFLHKYNI